MSEFNEPWVAMHGRCVPGDQAFRRTMQQLSVIYRGSEDSSDWLADVFTEPEEPRIIDRIIACVNARREIPTDVLIRLTAIADAARKAQAVIDGPSPPPSEKI